MNLDATIMFCSAVFAFELGICLVAIVWALKDIQRTLAKLPAHMNERKEIVLPPQEAARQGDVIFHIPSSQYGDRS